MSKNEWYCLSMTDSLSCSKKWPPVALKMKNIICNICKLGMFHVKGLSRAGNLRRILWMAWVVLKPILLRPFIYLFS